MTNADNSKCPDSCFRPVGLALDDQGRIFMSSDATGEIYILAKTNANSSASSSTKKSAGVRQGSSNAAGWVFGISALLLLNAL